MMEKILERLCKNGKWDAVETPFRLLQMRWCGSYLSPIWHWVCFVSGVFGFFVDNDIGGFGTGDDVCPYYIVSWLENQNLTGKIPSHMDEIRGWSFSSIPSLFCFEWEVGASSQATSQMLQFHPGWVYELEVSCCGNIARGYDSFVKGESYSYSSHSWNLCFHPLFCFLGGGCGGGWGAIFINSTNPSESPPGVAMLLPPTLRVMPWGPWASGNGTWTWIEDVLMYWTLIENGGYSCQLG